MFQKVHFMNAPEYIKKQSYLNFVSEPLKDVILRRRIGIASVFYDVFNDYL